MDLAVLDQELARLRAETSRVSANLLELEAEPTRELLASIELHGLTATRWSDASRRLAGLFVSFQALRSLLDDAAAQRDSWVIVTSPRIERLRAMLLGCSIERPAVARTIGERDLLDRSRVVDRCTPDELLREMAADFDVVKDVVFGVAGCWDELPPRIRGVRERLERLDPPARGDLDGRLTELAELVMADPLAVDRDHLAEIELEVHEIEAVRDDAAGELAAISALVAGLPALVAGADAARHSIAERFADHHVPPAVELDEALADRVDAVERLAATGAWRDLATELAALRAIAADLVERADQVEARCAALVARRAELRGRLDAFEAKAGARELIEETDVSALFEQARAALSTAPIDLDQAGALVQAYGDTLHREDL